MTCTLAGERQSDVPVLNKRKEKLQWHGQRVNELNAVFVVVSELSAESLSLNVTGMEVLLRVKRKKR